jgi:glycosyltransferase involved in cell wall biosynthesis
MKVLVISSTFPPMRSGGGEYAFRLCQQLSQHGFDVHALVSRGADTSICQNFNIYPIMYRWGWSELPRLLRLVRRVCPEVVNIHFTGEIYHHQPMITLLPSILRRLFANMSIVTLIEYPTGANIALVSLAARLLRKGVAVLVGRSGVDWGYGTLLRDSDRLIAFSEQHRQVLKGHLLAADEKTAVIPPPPLLNISEEQQGLSRRRGREILGIEAEDFLVAYYGFLYPGKGIETLLESIHLVNQQRTPVCLALIGGSNEVILRSMNRRGYVHELEALCERLDIRGKVRFTGYYPSESDHGSCCLRAADVCVLPFDEGVMLNRSSVAAAAVHGLPIVTTRGPLLDTSFVEGENVLLCSPKDPPAMAAAIRLLVSDDQLRSRLQAGALALARRCYSWERTVEQTVALFHESRHGGKSVRPSPVPRVSLT